MYGLRVAKEQARLDPPFSSLAVNTLHDTVETMVHLAADQLGATVAGKDFMAAVTAVSTALPDIIVGAALHQPGLHRKHRHRPVQRLEIWDFSSTLSTNRRGSRCVYRSKTHTEGFCIKPKANVHSCVIDRSGIRLYIE